eukprot:CFRG3063T1
MADTEVSTVVHVTSLSPVSTEETISALFSHVGNLKRVQLQIVHDSVPGSAKTAYVEFEEPDQAALALHLNNVLWIDRPIIIVPVESWPDEPARQPLTSHPSSLKIAEAVPRAMAGVVPHVAGSLGGSSAVTDALMAMNPNSDPNRVEEIRRTIYCGNLDSQTVTAKHMLDFFKLCGPINFVRMAGDETQPTRFAFIEFGTHAAANAALNYNGALLQGRPMKVNHSKNAIVKPPTKKAEVQAKEFSEAQRKIQEQAALLVSKMSEIDNKSSNSDAYKNATDSHRDDIERRDRDRGRSDRGHRRSRTRSPGRRASRVSRSRSRDRNRRRSRSPARRRDRDHRRSRSPRRSSTSGSRRKESNRYSRDKRDGDKRDDKRMDGKERRRDDERSEGTKNVSEDEKEIGENKEKGKSRARESSPDRTREEGEKSRTDKDKERRSSGKGERERRGEDRESRRRREKKRHERDNSSRRARRSRSRSRSRSQSPGKERTEKSTAIVGENVSRDHSTNEQSKPKQEVDDAGNVCFSP